MTKEKLLKWLMATFTVLIVLSYVNPTSASHTSVEKNYLVGVRHDARVLGDKKLSETKSDKLISYGAGVCGELSNAKDKEDAAIKYLAKKSFSKNNTDKENLNIIQVVTTNAVRHLCPEHISLLK